jgi:hypothetical protein
LVLKQKCNRTAQLNYFFFLNSFILDICLVVKVKPEQALDAGWKSRFCGNTGYGFNPGMEFFGHFIKFLFAL